jgi:hypothetical protein
MIDAGAAGLSRENDARKGHLTAPLTSNGDVRLEADSSGARDFL